MNKDTADLIAKIYNLQAEAIASGIKITRIEVPFSEYHRLASTEVSLFCSDDRQGTIAGIEIVEYGENN
jgi:hypothetical protein